MGGGELRGAPRGFHFAPFKSLFWFRDFYVFRFTSRQRCLQLRPTAASGDKAAITSPVTHILLLNQRQGWRRVGGHSGALKSLIFSSGVDEEGKQSGEERERRFDASGSHRG